jgi:hypothetical protein
LGEIAGCHALRSHPPAGGAGAGGEEVTGQRIDEIVDHPSFERIRSEILGNVERRAQESAQAFNGLMTFCGIIYTGATVAILGYMGGRASVGVPYLSILSFGFFAFALVVFAILYQWHSQLHAARYAFYARIAEEFFLRRSTLEELLEAGHKFQSRWLYWAIFWAPLVLAVCGFISGALGVLGVGPATAPVGKP